MINKFKDFLKNFSFKRKKNSSDQDEFLDEEITDDNLQDEDKTGEVRVPAELTARPKLQASSLRKNSSEASEGDSLSHETAPPPLDEALTEEDKTPAPGPQVDIPAIRIGNEDATGEFSAAASSSASWKTRLTSSYSELRSKIGNVKMRSPREWKLPEGMKNKSGSPLSLSPNMSKAIERFLSREARETIHQVTLVVLICSVTYTLGKITALALRSAPATTAPREYSVSINLEEDFNPAVLSQVRSINIFRTNTGLGSKKKVADTKCDQAQQSSNLPIKLVNTVVLQDSVKSLASVQLRGERDLQEVREGDQISNLAKIFKITRLEILVKNLESGVCESIASEKARETNSPISVMTPAQSREYIATKKLAGIENQGNKFQISKTLLDDKMKDIASILTQARAIKIQNPDGTLAFKLTEMDPQGIFPYLGLQDQDIITSINGKPIYDMNEVMGLFARIKNLDQLQLGVKREGSESVLDYNIKK